MALQCGIVGLPNVGKSTLFNALTSAKALAANYPFATKEPNVGMITVPDERLDKLAELVSPEKVQPTTVEIVDIAGLIKGASKGGKKVEEIEAMLAHLSDSKPARSMDLSDAGAEMLKEMQLLTAKPIIYVCNVDEESVTDGNEHTKAFAGCIEGENAEMILISAGIEADIAELDTKEERMEFIEAMGLTEPGVNQVIRSCYNILNLITYFTAGVKEVRAWTVLKGSTAPQAAGVIHTDFEKGFIRAEVIKYADYVEHGSEAAVKTAGKQGIEGKDYIVTDGDVMHFRFNV